MVTLRQKTVNGETIRLKRLKNRHPELSNNQYMYVVEYGDGDRRDPRFTKQNGVADFNRAVSSRGGSAGSTDSSRGGSGGGVLSDMLGL